MKARYYAGIGSRETPHFVCQQMATIAHQLGTIGWTLRSGGAEGADAAFEAGLCRHHKRQIFLPWIGFNNHKSRRYGVDSNARAIAESFHPTWDKLSDTQKLLIARNSYQVLGADLQTPVEFVVCWTPDGRSGGGTGQAIRIANARDIPVFDLAVYNYETVCSLAYQIVGGDPW